jgi:hypothetical protein
LALLIAVIACCSACGDSTDHTGPTAPSDPNANVIAADRTGPIQIVFVSSTPPPGSTIMGCGSDISGCRGRLTMTLRLIPPQDGPVLYVRFYLHSMRNGMACLIGQTAPFAVVANRTVDIDVTLDQSDACEVPQTMSTMDAIVEGPAPVASRQAWGVRYVFTP